MLHFNSLSNAFVADATLLLACCRALLREPAEAAEVFDEVDGNSSSSRPSRFCRAASSLPLDTVRREAVEVVLFCEDDEAEDELGLLLAAREDAAAFEVEDLALRTPRSPLVLASLDASRRLDPTRVICSAVRGLLPSTTSTMRGGGGG